MKELSQRQLRVGENFRKEIADMILNANITVDNCLISIVKVVPAGDLGYASVYFRVTNVAFVDIVKQFLNTESSSFGYQLMKKLRLKKLPKLQFYYDNTFEEGEAIKNLLSDL